MYRIGIDTNVLIRFIVRDDIKQAKKADRILSLCSSKNPGIINQIVLVELVWVLRRLYLYSKSDIISVLEIILSNNDIFVLNCNEAKEALIEYEMGGADFSDYLTSHINNCHDVVHTVTFDKKASRSKYFALIE